MLYVYVPVALDYFDTGQVVLDQRPGDLALVHDVIVHILLFAGLAPARVVVAVFVFATH